MTACIACAIQTTKNQFTADPHFGKGMYFGLSGSVDWIFRIVQAVAGVELALHDPTRADLTVTPHLPPQLGGELTFRRVIHRVLPGGGYRQVPLTVKVRPGASPAVRINGRRAQEPRIEDLSRYRRVTMEIVSPAGR